MAEQKPGLKIGKFFISNIVLLGLTSLFMDMSTEMVYPLIPLYIASFGVTPAVVGIIEGIAESLASFLKVLSGYWGDKAGNEKQLSFAGYLASVFYKLILLVSTSWVGVLVARIVDRVGKGIRTAPRDAMVAASGSDKKLGRAFGLHKMLDMTGSAIGILLALIIVSAGMKIQAAFLWSLVPAVFALVFIPLVKKVKIEKAIKQEKFSLKGLKLDKKLVSYLGVVFLFSLGNSSNAFLLLRAGSSGYSNTDVILMYLIYSVSSSVFAYPMGIVSDKIGRAKLLVPGYLIYGLVYLGFGFAPSSMMPVLFGVYGLYTALTSGAERAFIAESSPKQFKGTILGIYGMLQGFGLLCASLLAGFLWDSQGANSPFLFGGVIGILASILIAVIMTQKNKRIQEEL